MTVNDWAPDFFGRHVQRVPRADWPPPEDLYWDTFRAALVRHGVTEAVADEASQLLAERPPAHLGQQIEALLGQVRLVWSMSEVAVAAPDCREAAELASRDCDDCGGHTGLASRYRKHSRGTADARGHARPEVVVFHCRCALGRWVKAAHARQPELAGRIPDLADHPFLWGHEYRSRPDTPAVPPTPPPPPSRADRLPPLEAPAPTVGEVDGRLVRRQGGQVQVQEAPIF